VAIKDLLTTLIQTYPKRQGSPRGFSTRTYANDTVADVVRAACGGGQSGLA